MEAVTTLRLLEVVGLLWTSVSKKNGADAPSEDVGPDPKLLKKKSLHLGNSGVS